MQTLSVPAAGRVLGGISAVPVSLEQRLEHLQRGLERLQKLRSQMELIADRLSNEPEGPSRPPATPSPTDLSGRYGETISFVHDNIESLEVLVARLDRSLFESQKAAQPDRVR